MAKELSKLSQIEEIVFEVKGEAYSYFIDYPIAIQTRLTGPYGRSRKYYKLEVTSDIFEPQTEIKSGIYLFSDTLTLYWNDDLDMLRTKISRRIFSTVVKTISRYLGYRVYEADDWVTIYDEEAKCGYMVIITDYCDELSAIGRIFKPFKSTLDQFMNDLRSFEILSKM